MDEVEGAFWEEEFCGSFPSDFLVSVEFEGDIVELLLGEAAEVFAFGQAPPQQAVGVFAEAALPWAVGVGEIDVDAGLLLGAGGAVPSRVPGRRSWSGAWPVRSDSGYRRSRPRWPGPSRCRA